MSVEVRTKEYGGEDRCLACIRQATGTGLGPTPAHTCLSHRTVAQIDSDDRHQRLAQLNRPARRRGQHPAGTTLRTRTVDGGILEVR
jgi:hypothetical protein